MTRRSRRASSAPQRVGSEAGLTSSRPAPHAADRGLDVEDPSPAPMPPSDLEDADPSPQPASTRDVAVDQTKDDTDEGWGERGEDDASARWLRENRPPHWS